jgi:hypothetical protein
MIISSQDDTDLNAKTTTPQYPDWGIESKQFFEDLASGKQTRRFLCDLPSTASLLDIENPQIGDAVTFRGQHLIYGPDLAWHEDKPAEIDTEGLLEDVLPENDSLHMLGTWPHDQEFPGPEGYKHLDAYFWKGRLAVMLNGKWEHQDVAGTSVPPTPTVPLEQYDALVTQLASAFKEDGLFNIVGRTDCLPMPALYAEHDAFIVRDEIWIRDFDGQAIWKQVYMPQLVKEQIRLYDERQKVKAQPEPVPDVPVEDKGAMARDLMTEKALVKTLRRARIKYLCYLWFMILLIVSAFVVAGYAYIQRDLKIGRYSDARECSIKVGNLTITGKRTYSYPAYSLWGQRWVQESDVQEVTVVNLPGVRLDIIGDAEPKYWAYRFSDGERGTQILKPAIKYTFFTDKGLIMATYGGFCKPVDKQEVADDPKAAERSIID